jgi:hypothetical protein
MSGGKRYFGCTAVAMLILFLVLPVSVQAGPDVNDFIVTDVTTSSFSVVWASDEPSRIEYPYLYVFDDSNGLVPTPGAEVTPYPVSSGSGIIPLLAEDNGVMKVRVTGLAPDTTYYFQTMTTSKITGETTLHPATAPFLSVTTENRTMRERTDGDDIVPFSNDLIMAACFLDDGVTPAEGTLIIATVEGGNHPVSAFIGDGIASPFALVDLNNLFSPNSSSTLDVSERQPLTLVNFRGIQGNALVTHRVPENTGLSEIQQPDPALYAGWNMISLQLEPDETDVETVLAPLWGSFSSIWEYDPRLDKWFRYDRAGPPFLNNLLDLHAGKGYWLVLESEGSLRINGRFSDELIPIYTGWNLVGYRSLVPWAIPGVMENVESVLDTVWGYETASDSWLRYSPAGPLMLNDLKWIVPGKAYWILATGEGQW